MKPFHKPEGYTTVSPYLIVDGASRTIEFLQRVFDAVDAGAGEEGRRGQAGRGQGSWGYDLVDRDPHGVGDAAGN